MVCVRGGEMSPSGIRISVVRVTILRTVVRSSWRVVPARTGPVCLPGVVGGGSRWVFVASGLARGGYLARAG